MTIDFTHCASLDVITCLTHLVAPLLLAATLKKDVDEDLSFCWSHSPHMQTHTLTFISGNGVGALLNQHHWGCGVLAKACSAVDVVPWRGCSQRSGCSETFLSGKISILMVKVSTLNKITLKNNSGLHISFLFPLANSVFGSSTLVKVLALIFFAISYQPDWQWLCFCFVLLFCAPFLGY